MDLSLCSLSRVWIVWKPSWHRPRTIWALEPAIGSLLTTVHHLTCEPCFRECLFIVHTCYYHLSLLLLHPAPPFPLPPTPLPPTPLPPPSCSTTPSVALGIIVILVVLQLMYTFFQRTGTVGQTGRSSSSFNPFVSHLPQHLVLQ